MSVNCLITDINRMDEDAKTENMIPIKQWEQYLRCEIYPNRHITPVTRALFTYPSVTVTDVRLGDAFPVLKRATIVPICPELLPRCPQVELLDNVQLHFAVTFDTVWHGQVHLIAVSVPETLRSRGKCHIQLKSEDDEEITLSMTNHGDIEDLHIFFVTLIVPYRGCRRCRYEAIHDDMYRCGKCWRKLQFPVIYCSKRCQSLDFMRHCKHEGCGPAA